RGGARHRHRLGPRQVDAPLPDAGRVGRLHRVVPGDRRRPRVGRAAGGRPVSASTPAAELVTRTVLAVDFGEWDRATRGGRDALRAMLGDIDRALVPATE